MGIVFIIIVILVMTYALLVMPRVTMRPNMTNILTDYAHRGFYDNNDGVPENSLAAFKYAVVGGFGIELDVQLTADGEVVVFHDYNLKRMCGEDVELSSLTLAELRKCKLAGTNYGIPTLKEVLNLVDGRVPLLIELKGESNDVSLCPKVAELLKNYSGTYSVESFNPFLLRWFKKNSPDTARGQLVKNMLKERQGMNIFICFALSFMLTNLFSRPDFIAVDERFMRGMSVWVCANVFSTKLFVWTVKKKEHLNINRENGDCSIFEGFDPTA